MKIEAGKTHKTREGKKVRVVCSDVKSRDYPVVGLWEDDNFETVETFTFDGRFYLDEESSCDIVEEWREPFFLYAILNEDGELYATEENEREANRALQACGGGAKIVKLVEAQE